MTINSSGRCFLIIAADGLPFRQAFEPGLAAVEGPPSFLICDGFNSIHSELPVIFSQVAKRSDLGPIKGQIVNIYRVDNSLCDTSIAVTLDNFELTGIGYGDLGVSIILIVFYLIIIYCFRIPCGPGALPSSLPHLFISFFLSNTKPTHENEKKHKNRNNTDKQFHNFTSQIIRFVIAIYLKLTHLNREINTTLIGLQTGWVR